MRLAQKIFLFIIPAFSVLLIISIFLPTITIDYLGIIEKVYFFDMITESVFVYALIALVVGTFLLLSPLKNMKLIAVGLMLFSALSFIFICLTLSNALIMNGESLIQLDLEWKNSVGYYFLLTISSLYIVALLAYTVLYFCNNYLGSRTSNKNNENDIDKKFNKLQQLKELNLLTPEEYESKRSELVNSIKF